jgi:hypothetical protein
MRFWIAVIALGLVVYLLGLVVNLPAARLAPVLAERGVVLESARGSIWEGAGSRLLVRGLEIPAPSWDLSGPALFMGRVNARLATGWGDARVRAGMGGDLALRDVDMIIPLETLRGIPGAEALSLGGDLVLDLAGIEVSDSIPRRAQGRVLWRDAVIGSLGTDLGGYEVVLETINETITGRIRDTGGPVEASGAVALEPDGQYRLDLRLAARAGAEPFIENGLRLLGPQDPRGGVRLTRQGSLEDLRL